MESLTGDETLQAKHAFEAFAKTHGVTIKHYHCNNGCFAKCKFLDACEQHGQTTSFCAVGAHHQNGIAECCMHDLTESACTMLLHAVHHWPQAVNGHLWPSALKHAVNIQNSLPRKIGHDNPLSWFAGTSIVPNLDHFHPFGCPAYVLEALQSQGVFPKWEERAQVGIYLCHSPCHASNVSLVLNTQTRLVSPQFHLVHDDNFDTVTKDAHFTSLCQQKAHLHLTQQQAAKSNQQLPTNEAPPASALNDIAVIPSSLSAPWQQPPMPQPKGETTPQQPLNHQQAPDNQAATQMMQSKVDSGQPSSPQVIQQPSQPTADTQSLTDRAAASTTSQPRHVMATEATIKVH